MQKIKRVGQWIDLINEWVGRVVSFFLIIIMILVVMEVTLRYGFNRPTIWIWDVNVQLFAALVFLGGGYHLLHRQYVVVDVLYIRLPPKVKAIADLIAFVSALCFFIVLLWKGGDFALTSIMIREHTMTTFGPPVYHIKSLVPIGAFLMLLQWGTMFIRGFITDITGEEK